MNERTSHRPVVLIFVSFYLPGYKAGGPLRTISNMVDVLGNEFDFRIITSDRDATDTEPYCGIAAGAWNRVGKAQVLYLSPAERSLRQIARILERTSHDVLYLNSFFDRTFTQKPLIARWLALAPKTPCILAPRGEFSQGALALKSTRKKAFIVAASATRLYRGLEWHASSKHEAADIHRAIDPLAQSVQIAIDLPAPPPTSLPAYEPRAPGEPLRVVFLSRISQMKNLDFALRVLSRVRVPVVFSIFGPAEDKAYQADCERLAALLPPHVQAFWRGPVGPTEVPEVMAGHDLLFLPTRGENFGHVIAEALNAGTPVLLSDTTPWRDLAELGIGEDFPLADSEKFVAAIERAAMQPIKEVVLQRARVFAYARERYKNAADVEANRQLFTVARK